MYLNKSFADGMGHVGLRAAANTCINRVCVVVYTCTLELKLRSIGHMNSDTSPSSLQPTCSIRFDFVIVDHKFSHVVLNGPKGRVLDFPKYDLKVVILGLSSNKWWIKLVNAGMLYRNDYIYTLPFILFP